MEIRKLINNMTPKQIEQLEYSINAKTFLGDTAFLIKAVDTENNHYKEKGKQLDYVAENYILVSKDDIRRMLKACRDAYVDDGGKIFMVIDKLNKLLKK